MAWIRSELACIATLLFMSGGTMAAESGARSSSELVADDAAKKARGPGDELIRQVARLHADGEFRRALKLFQEGKFTEVERRFAWIAQIREGTSWGERGRYYLAECQYQQGKYVDALASFERLHADYPGTAYRSNLVSREYQLAQIWLGRSNREVQAGGKPPLRARFDGRPPIVDTRGLALQALEHVLQNDPTGPLADAAAIQIADYYRKQHDYRSAILYYDQFVTEYPRSRFNSYARLAATVARTRSNTEVPWAEAGLKAARELVEDFLRAVPDLDDHGDRDDH